ncbi:TPA: hypothetical protein ACUB6L_004035 [Raoultella ornithinolytica]
MTNNQLNRERLEKIKSWCETYGAGSNVMLPAEEAEELARMALATMNSEPVGFTDERNLHHIAMGRETSLIWGKQNSEAGDVPLYRHAQQPIVPDEMDRIKAFDMFDSLPDGDVVDCVQYAWNACRAAMLQAGTLTNEDAILPVTQLRPASDLYGITSPTGSETMFTFDPVEASNLKGGGWSVQEYVELERLQEAVAGNSPVIPEGYVMVPKEPTQAMCAAFNDSDYGRKSLRERYVAMLAAAPQEVK